MVTQQDFGISMVGGALAVGLVAAGLGAAENMIKNKGKLKIGKGFNYRNTRRRIVHRPKRRKVR